jgi:hypothetical protein
VVAVVLGDPPLRVERVVVIAQISQTHAQVMMQGVGDADGEAESQQSLSKPKGIEIVVTAEEPA